MQSQDKTVDNRESISNNANNELEHRLPGPIMNRKKKEEDLQLQI